MNHRLSSMVIIATFCIAPLTAQADLFGIWVSGKSGYVGGNAPVFKNFDNTVGIHPTTAEVRVAVRVRLRVSVRVRVRVRARARVVSPSPSPNPNPNQEFTTLTTTKRSGEGAEKSGC